MTDPTTQHLRETIDNVTRQMNKEAKRNADDVRVGVEHHTASPWSFLWVDAVWRIATRNSRVATKLIKTTVNTMAQLDRHGDSPGTGDGTSGGATSPYSPVAVSFRSYQSALEIWNHWLVLPAKLATQEPPKKQSKRLATYGAVAFGAEARPATQYRGPFDVSVGNPFEDLDPGPDVAWLAIAPDGTTAHVDACDWDADEYMLGFAATEDGDQAAVDAFVATFDELHQHLTPTNTEG